jgi:hypothetical protein
VLAGILLHNASIKMKALFAPYYLFMMNYAVIKGTFLFISGRYTVNWPKSKRG